jgi:ubiquinol-cytochrome c reductase cytochrome b subunit
MNSPWQAVADWLDSRAGTRKILHEMLDEPVPGGARWRYVWGSALAIAFLTQVVTGLFLWMAYSPSTLTAWESVFYIEHEMNFGWILRGIHHFMAQAMVVLMAIHFVQVVWDGAYRAPRELNFVIGILLMLLVLALALTGYLLPWDQKGYWATNVGTNIASQAPLAGPQIKTLAIGGAGYGHHTLTRFFALHAGVLPLAVGLLMVVHIALFRRHGLHAYRPGVRPDDLFWPDQVLRDAVAALGVLAVVLGLTVYYGGAELTAPADPANPYDAARPEWYFLFLFQFLKYFPGGTEVWGAFFIPGLLLAYLLLMPWIGRSRAGHALNVGVLAVVLGGAVLLTAQALHDDYYALWNKASDPLPEDGPRREVEQARRDASERFLRARREAHDEAQRVIALARSDGKIPPAGALAMMYDDAYLQGPRLFRRHCASCHNYARPDAPDDPRNIVHSAPSAPNLFGLGSPAWIAGWLDPQRIASPDYLGYDGSPFADGDMVAYVQEACGDDVDPDQRQQVRQAFAAIAVALAEESGLPRQEALDPQQVARGRALLAGELADTVPSGTGCVDCHKWGDAGELGAAPDLTGYLSRQWLLEFIRNPAAERFYPDSNDRMPAFAPHDDPALNQLDDQSLGLIVDWLRGDWRLAEDDDQEGGGPSAEGRVVEAAGALTP